MNDWRMFEDPTGRTLMILGGLLLLGFAMHALGRRTRLPRVTLLLLLGVGIGPSGLDVQALSDGVWFDLVAKMALAIVGFLLGERFTLAAIRDHGRVVLMISATVVGVTAVVVFVGLKLFGASTELALILACIATATAPAATVDVIRELNAKGPFSRVLERVVALDDAWGLILFSLALAGASTLGGANGVHVLLGGLWEVVGGVLIGVVLGIPMALITGRIRSGQLTTVEALGGIFLAGGFAVGLEVSFLIATMTLGAVVANLAQHHERPFHAIEDIETPFIVVFFLLAGASLEIDSLWGIGGLGLTYMTMRVLGRVLGGAIGGRVARVEPLTRRWIGLALLPQAGVAIGMALIAVERFPELRSQILPLVLGSTVIFELFGPILTRRAIVATGEVVVAPEE